MKIEIQTSIQRTDRLIDYFNDLEIKAFENIVGKEKNAGY